MANSEDNYQGWFLYDASCGFCCRWVARWEATITAAGFKIAPLPADQTADVRLTCKDGTVLQGAAVYLYVMRRIWWARPLAIIFSLPGLRWLFEQIYRCVRRHRHAL